MVSDADGEKGVGWNKAIEQVHRRRRDQRGERKKLNVKVSVPGEYKIKQTNEHPCPLEIRRYAVFFRIDTTMTKYILTHVYYIPLLSRSIPSCTAPPPPTTTTTPLI